MDVCRPETWINDHGGALVPGEAGEFLADIGRPQLIFLTSDAVQNSMAKFDPVLE